MKIYLLHALVRFALILTAVIPSADAEAKKLGKKMKKGLKKVGKALKPATKKSSDKAPASDTTKTTSATIEYVYSTPLVTKAVFSLATDAVRLVVNTQLPPNGPALNAVVFNFEDKDTDEECHCVCEN